MSVTAELRAPSRPDRPRPRRRHGALFKTALAALAAAGMVACASMGTITRRTADSPSEPWVPPAKETPPPEPLPAPAIPAELQAPGHAWSLVDIVDVGLSNDPQTRAAWNAARAASAIATASLGAYLPQIGGSLPATKQKMVFAGGQFIVDQATLTPTASLNMLIFDFGGREANVRAARRALEAANWTQNAVLQNVILDIENAYYQYIAARALLEAQEAGRKSAQTNYDAANERHQAGVATIADVLQAKTALSSVDLQLVTTRGLIQALHGGLATAMGLPANAAFEVADVLPEDIPFDAVAKEVELCIKDAEAKRPDLAAARAQVREAEAGVAHARSTMFPSFSLSGNLGRIYYQNGRPSNPFFSVTVSANLAFLFGFQQYGVLAAKAQADAARDQMTALSRGIELQVWTSYYGLKTAEQQVATARDLLASARASQEVALGRYKEGVGSILDLLAAETVLENARVELIKAKAGWFLALVQFTHDTGALVPPGASANPGPPAAAEKGVHRP
jgi:outer membrane protein